MQIYADVLNKEIKVPLRKQGGAVGSAVFGSYAGGYFDTIQEAAKFIGRSEEIIYTPIAKNAEKYKELYGTYKDLFAFFSTYKP